MDWSLNDAQAGVLSWMCTTPDAEPPPGNWKTSVAALVSRGLATVSKKGGGYTATATDAGRYFHQHGEYPADSAGGRRAARVLVEKEARRTASAPVEPSPRGPGSETVTGTPKGRVAKQRQRSQVAATPPRLPEAAPQRIVKPHPAVRSLMDRPIALPKDADARRRAFVAAHMLIQAAEQAGFTVEGCTQPKQRGRERPFRGETLVTLDAGHQAVPVRIGEFEKGVDHVLTAEEIAHKERWGHSWAPRYDYLPTGLLFFRVYASYSSTRLLETSTKWLGDYVPKVLALVQTATEVALAHEEQARKREQERKAQKEAARLLGKRRAHYEQWEQSLLDQAKAWGKATRLRAFLASFGSAQHSPAAEVFREWASGYADMIDPTTTLQVPDGEPPGMPHDERLRRGRPTEAPNPFASWR
ncbi:hypothetical protein [Micropruina sp.]|uniref:hypothetical protein n=1 Tax=Micropruina sp. TaxID=2737536 RepID=UPI0039E4E7DA